jgi:hypothetical protein
MVSKPKVYYVYINENVRRYCWHKVEAEDGLKEKYVSTSFLSLYQNFTLVNRLTLIGIWTDISRISPLFWFVFMIMIATALMITIATRITVVTT